MLWEGMQRKCAWSSLHSSSTFISSVLYFCCLTSGLLTTLHSLASRSGGTGFGLLPPRVNYEYGSGVEELLMLPPFKILADVTPGLIKVALRPPVCVDSVAGACAKAALDDSGADLPVLDGTDDINEYSGQPKSTGLTDALEWSKEQAIKFYDWAKVEVPKAVDSVQKVIDESKSK